MSLPSKRISLECPVVDADALREWVRAVVAETGGKVSWTSDYHMTVLHLGRPNEIFEAVHANMPSRLPVIDESRFLRQLRKWLQVHVLTLRHPVTVSVDGLIPLGATAPYALACRIATMPRQLRNLHQDLLGSLGRFMQEDLGVADGPGLLSSSSAFGFSGKSWTPHITVGSGTSLKNLELPEYKVRLGPMLVRNGAVLGIFDSQSV